MIENKCMVDGVEIKYKFKPRKYDTQHLIIIFSGFGGAGEFTYDFENALQDCPAHVLWIKDDFYDHCTYYICQKMNFNIEEAIHNFIMRTVSELKLNKEQCTLAGFSKGGSAALYFGLKFQFKNIISTVPQFYIGSYVKNNWPAVALNMLGEVSDANVKLLDNLLLDTFKKDSNLEKNIYLLTSEADIQFKKELEPNLSLFMKYRNFNLLLSRSILVREHSQVTIHNLPLILGICYSISQGAIPRYGYTELIGDEYVTQNSPSATPLTILKKIKIENGRIYPEGISILRGLSCAENKDIMTKLSLSSSHTTKEIVLAKAHMPYLTRNLYDGIFVNYDKGWFCTLNHKGLNIDEILPGEYIMSIIVTCQNITKKSQLTVDSHLNNRVLAEELNLKIISKNGVVYFYKT
ncbi:accessory Sec system protein Asp2 [Yersinia intermedia]|uniref:accessory Sec system protein Asp2 n=1 Tax=Yersinia intermedia TaxID=631 RepID=UPI0005E24267|nr:accessory Sec system protein Asp2 [Yersinia intermedia]CNB36040.1 accessory Sec system protein Asp2 [Yersinia intermedia]CRE60811.1 accessory Sec system protein Asp2 [Yersinia intermedia]